MDTTIEQLGEPRIESPLRHVQFVDDDKRVLYSCSAEDVEQDICAKQARRFHEGRTPQEDLLRLQQVEERYRHLWWTLPRVE